VARFISTARASSVTDNASTPFSEIKRTEASINAWCVAS
jgi:hypothetical protein